MFKLIIALTAVVFCFMAVPASVFAEAPEVSTAEIIKMVEASAAERAYAIDNLFLLLAAVLVFFMQAGFAMLEAGFNAAKNTVNILCKNFLDLCAGVILFYAVGYSLMYPGESFIGGFLGFAGFGISSIDPVAGAGVLHPQIDWLFQVAFAATAATIVSGAIAGRMRFISYLAYSSVLTGLIYPISGFWKWGGGWLDVLGFHDFAGSVLVHAVGGFAGLAGAIVLGPRIGRFGENAEKMPGHNLSMAALGTFILWVGWYGFNPGSQLAIVGAENTAAVAHIAVNTTLAAAAGALMALSILWIRMKKPVVSMGLNGSLAGLVGITASCDAVTNAEAIVIGLVAGVIVVAAIALLEKLKIDDPVGAFPVHGACGVWGGLAAGIFGDYSLAVQALGCIAVACWAFLTMHTLFSILRGLGVLRVSREVELAGLDLHEHGEEAYAGFPDLSDYPLAADAESMLASKATFKPQEA